MGAEVVHRHDPSKRAKGFAISAGLDYLCADAREVVVLIDADCWVAPNAIEILARSADHHQRPIQANYQMPIPPSNNRWNSVSGFAVRVRNEVRPWGLHRLGLPCMLAGSGMAFPRFLAGKPRWASDHIVEDMKVTYDLMVWGYSPRFCRDAVVRASLPEARQHAMQQRKRWEHGHLQTMAREVPRLVAHAIRSARPSLLVAAMDLMIPPLSLLVQLWCASALVILMLTLVMGFSGIPALVMLLSGVLLGSAIGVVWHVHGRDYLSLTELGMIPVYVATKVPLYLTALWNPQRAWKRTARKT